MSKLASRKIIIIRRSFIQKTRYDKTRIRTMLSQRLCSNDWYTCIRLFCFVLQPSLFTLPSSNVTITHLWPRWSGQWKKVVHEIYISLHWLHMNSSSNPYPRGSHHFWQMLRCLQNKTLWNQLLTNHFIAHKFRFVAVAIVVSMLGQRQKRWCDNYLT